MGPLSATGCQGGSSNLKVALRTPSWEACDKPPSACCCSAAVPGRGPEAPEGGREQGREGGSCRWRAQGQAWENQAGGGFAWSLTDGALCPGCPHLEGWPSTSPLNPAPSLPGRTWPPSSHSPLEGLCQEPLPTPLLQTQEGGHPCETRAPHSVGPRSLAHSLWG